MESQTIEFEGSGGVTLIADAWGDPVGYAPPPAPPQLAPLSSLPVVLGERRASLPPIPAGLGLGDRSSSRDYSPTRTPPRRF